MGFLLFGGTFQKRHPGVLVRINWNYSTGTIWITHLLENLKGYLFNEKIISKIGHSSQKLLNFEKKILNTYAQPLLSKFSIVFYLVLISVEIDKINLNLIHTIWIEPYSIEMTDISFSDPFREFDLSVEFAYGA